MKNVIRVLIVDDHAFVRAGLRALMATAPDIEVIGEAADGKTAVRLIKTTTPDVITLDISTSHNDRINAIQQLRQASSATKILVLTNVTEKPYVIAALQTGAHGYLLKDGFLTDLLDAIRLLYSGKSPLHPSITAMLKKHPFTRKPEEQ